MEDRTGHVRTWNLHIGDMMNGRTDERPGVAIAVVLGGVLAVMAAGAVAVLVAAAMAGAAASDSATSELPACANAGGSGGPMPCVWDAEKRGNGEGQSVIVYSDGIVSIGEDD